MYSGYSLEIAGGGGAKLLQHLIHRVIPKIILTLKFKNGEGIEFTKQSLFLRGWGVENDCSRVANEMSKLIPAGRNDNCR